MKLDTLAQDCKLHMIGSSLKKNRGNLETYEQGSRFKTTLHGLMKERSQNKKKFDSISNRDIKFENQEGKKMPKR